MPHPLAPFRAWTAADRFTESERCGRRPIFGEICLRASRLWKYLILALAVAAYLYPFVRIFSDAPDYGVFLNGADLVNHGAIPSRDFVEPQGPGSFLWLAMFFRLFGTTLETARAVLISTGAGIALLIFHLSRRLGATGLFATLFVTIISVPLLPINSPHYDSNLFALAALSIFLLAWDKVDMGEVPKIWTLVLSAALCGVTTWMIQQKGCYLALACLVCVMRAKAFRPAAIFAATFAAAALLPFAFFFAVHALPDVLYANFIWPMSTYSDLNAAPYGFPIWDNVRVLLGQHVNQPVSRAEDVAFALPFLLVAVLPLLLPLAAWWSGRKWFGSPMLPYWLAGYALWFSELHRIDMGHLRNGAIIMALLFFSICEAGGNKYLRRVGLAFTICAAMAGTSNFRMSWESDKKLETRRGVIHVKDDQPLLEFLEKNTRPGEEVFVYPYQPIYYFVENLKNPTRFSYMQYHFHTAAQFQEATRDLEHKKVRYVVFDSALSGPRFKEVFPAYRHPDKSQLIMEPYLESHYYLARDLGRFHILERLHDAP